MKDLDKSIYIRGLEIDPEPIQWLWYPYIPFGKVTLLQGDPGDGKSTFMLNIAAALSIGKALPFSKDNPLPPMNIIYQTTEDDLADTVIPRFIKAGGDRTKIIFIKEQTKPLTFSDPRIKETIIETGAQLLILDPLSSYIGDNCTMNNANDVRSKFNHLIEVAKQTKCAIVVVAHLNKMPGTKAIYRSSGSIDVVGAARSALLIAKEKPDSKDRIMVQQKSNLAPTGSGIRFEVNENGIEFIEECTMTADELLGNYMPKIGRPDDEMQTCMAFIKDLLSNGPVPSSECFYRIKEAGLHEHTAKNAKKKLSIVSYKNGDNWFWTLPS